MVQANPGPSQETPSAGKPRPQVARRKRILFACGALLIANLVVVAIEGALRLFGLGGHTPVLRVVGDTPKGRVVVSDASGAATYFFANRSKPGGIFEATFYQPKPTGVFRVFWLGESAAKGFPQPPCLASSAFFEAMLQDLWPDRKVEVINLACTAMASYPIRGILEEAINYEPDLVVVYCGNNEFFGAYGVASLHRSGDSVGAMQFQRWMRSLALTQAFERLTAKVESAPDKTLMERMMTDVNIGVGDARRDAAARNLGENVAAMIALCKDRKVPIVICNSPVNERDLSPLGSGSIKHFADEEQRIEQALNVPESPDALKVLGRIQALRPDEKTDARLSYAWGKALTAAGRHQQAVIAFQQAVDFDPMPWRATSQTNGAIYAAARMEGALFCDLVQGFRRASPGQSIGWELMDDHVHPSLQGQDLVARSVVNVLSDSASPYRATINIDVDRVKNLADWKTYAARLGDCEYTQYAVAHTVRVINNIPFFKSTNPGALARYEKTIADLEHAMSPEVLKAVRNWQKPETHRGGTQRPITGMVARALMTERRYDQAERLFESAVRCVPPYSSWSLEFSYYMLLCRERNRKGLSEEDLLIAREAIDRGCFLMSHGHVGSGLTEEHIGLLHQLRKEWAEAIPYLLHARPKVSGVDVVAVDHGLVESYMRGGDRAAAERIIADGEAGVQYVEQYRRMRQAFLAASQPAAPP